MKIKSVLQILMPCTLIVSICNFAISCSTKPVLEEQDYFNFINDRTFSISGPVINKPDYISFGTAWILDSVKDSNHPYEYYLMSNYHVMGSWIETQTPFDKLYFYSNDLNQANGSKPNCTASVNFNQKGEDKKYSEYLNSFNDNQSHYLLASELNYRFDMAIFKYDFQNSLHSPDTNSYSQTQLKKRLDRLNEYGSKNYSITKIYNKNYPYKTSENFYYLGWPFSNQANSPVFKMKTFTIINTYESLDSLTADDGDDTVPSKPIYNANEYLAAYDSSAWGGGSSGSMIINKNYEVVGIHAGSRTYFLNNQTSYTYQRTIMFQNTKMQPDYNFVEKFYEWRLNN